MKIALKKHFCSILICFSVLFLFPLNTFALGTESVDFMWFNNAYTTNESWSGFSENGFARVHFNKDVNIFIPEQIDSTLYFSIYSRSGVTQTQGTLYVYDNSGNLVDTITPDKIFDGVDSGDAYISFSVYSFSGQFLKFDLPSNSETWDVVFSLSRSMPSTDSNLSSVITILNQINNNIQSGNDSTGIVIDEFNGTQDTFDDVLSEYRATEETFFNQFEEYNGQLSATFDGWSWGGLVSCADWVGSTLTSYYNNMGDFRQYIIYPLMLGIALFFLGRGSSIIGHLYRKPTETFTHIERMTDTWKSGGTTHSVSNVSTRRPGGKFRK